MGAPGGEPDGVFWPYLKDSTSTCARSSPVVKGTQWEDTAVSYVMNSYVGKGGEIWSSWLGSGVKGVSKESEVHNASGVVVFTEENTWTIKDYSGYPFNDTHFTVGNRTRQIEILPRITIRRVIGQGLGQRRDGGWSCGPGAADGGFG